MQYLYMALGYYSNTCASGIEGKWVPTRLFEYSALEIWANAGRDPPAPRREKKGTIRRDPGIFPVVVGRAKL